ncbi:hypothetical protein AN958_01081 [Leucoagaricus sp. SymC.cos]|nr:hypothetical protein AN958_01081 [Leucoagaricus sp. SymC.cos]
MDWLGWDIWVTCRPTCGYEETCYLPGWPFLLPNPSLPHSPPPLPPQSGYPLRPWVGRPKPFCIRRLPPYEAPGSDAKLDIAEEIGSSSSGGRGDGPISCRNTCWVMSMSWATLVLAFAFSEARDRKLKMPVFPIRMTSG